MISSFTGDIFVLDVGRCCCDYLSCKKKTLVFLISHCLILSLKLLFLQDLKHFKNLPSPPHENWQVESSGRFLINSSCNQNMKKFL